MLLGATLGAVVTAAVFAAPGRVAPLQDELVRYGERTGVSAPLYPMARTSVGG